MRHEFIPHRLRGIRLDARFVNRTGLANCPNCAAPISGPRCAFCGTIFVLPPVAIYDDEEDRCPICGFLIDSDILEGDTVRRIVYHQCARCGWRP